MIHTRVASLRIDREQIVHPLHHPARGAVVRTQLQGVEYLSACMRPTGGMHHTDTARLVVCGIPVSLQNTFELPEELPRTFPAAPHPEVEDDTSSRPAILPKIRLMILPALIVRLHANRGLIGLNVNSAE